MAAYPWTEAMSVGVPALDADHRCLVRIISLLAEVDHGAEARSTIETVLETLAMYARYHFAREERLMEECGFPAFEFHRAAHEEFTDHIRDLRLSLAGRATPGLAKELFDYLTQWLRHHILIQDMAYKPFVCGCGCGCGCGRGRGAGEDASELSSPSCRKRGAPRRIQAKPAFTSLIDGALPDGCHSSKVVARRPGR